jgi:hypothetical protein
MSNHTSQYKLYVSRYQLSYMDGRVGIFIGRVEVRDQAGNYQRDAQLHKLVEHLHNRTLEFAPLPDHKQAQADRASYGILYNYSPKQHIRALDMEIIIEQAAKDFPNAVRPEDPEAIYWQRDKRENVIKVYAVQSNGMEVFIAKFPDAR